MANLFGSPKVVTQQVAAPAAVAPTIPTPTPTPPAVLPDPTAPGVLEAQRRAQQQIIGRAGRQSTILTAPASRARSGADSYGSTTLGAGAAG